MGFWQGLDAGLSELMAQKDRQRELAARKEEAQADRDFRMQEAAKERAARREDIAFHLQESRRDGMLSVFAERAKTEAAGKALTAKAQSFFTRLEGVDDPRVAALVNDPEKAAELEDKVYELEVQRAESDIDLPPLSGQALLDVLTVSTSDGGVAVLDLTLEDILEMDMSDRAAYEEAMIKLSTPRSRVDARINPEAFRKPDPKKLEEGRKLFDQEVLRLANAALKNASEDTAAFADLKPLIDGYSKENSAERFALMDMFGMKAFENLEAVNNPYVQNLQEDPVLGRYAIKRISGDEEYDALPSGAAFYGPDGKLRRKP